MKKPITVTIVAYKDGRASFSIDKPGPAEGQTKTDKKGKVKKYASTWAAWRGALRQLKAVSYFYVPRCALSAYPWHDYYANLGGRWGWRAINRKTIKQQ